MTGLFLELENMMELDGRCFSGDGDGVEADDTAELGGESFNVKRFLGLVRVGNRSLVTEFGGVCHPCILP